jgi:hypothetical protein
MNQNIDKIMLQTRQYWYVDGIAELAFGVFSLLLGAYFGLQTSLPQDSMLGGILGIGFAGFVIFAALLMRWAVARLKQRLTFPRTGYVAYAAPKRSRRLLNAIVALGMAALVSILFARAPGSMAWIPAVSGLLIAVTWLYVGFRTGLGRFYALGVYSALAGGAISLSGMGEDPGLALYYAVLGVAMLVSGGWTLAAYLRHTQPPAGDELEISK